MSFVDAYSGLSANPNPNPQSTGHGFMVPTGRADGAARNAITNKSEARKFINRRHPEYLSYLQTSRWILDTLEGGDRYRDATYGFDPYNKPIYNLLRTPREIPPPPYSVIDEYGAALPYQPARRDVMEYTKAADEDFDRRRMRTPVPTFLDEIVSKHLGKLFKKEIKQKGPDDLIQWTENVDGRGTSLVEWIKAEVGPIFYSLGCIDILFDHPYVPEDDPSNPFDFGATAIERQCVCRYVLPENVLWWRKDYTGEYYLEVLIRDYVSDPKSNLVSQRFIHWTYEDWTVYAPDGEIESSGVHSYGVVPMQRYFDRRNPTLGHTPAPRLIGVVDKSKVYYNEESQHAASLSLHNSPLLQGPPDDASARGIDEDATVKIGRNFMLTKVANPSTGTYEGYEYVSPPTNMADFNEKRLSSLVERIERGAGLTRAVGAVGSERGPVAQSGISKSFDQDEGNDYLVNLAKSFGRLHYNVMMMSLLVIRDNRTISQNDVDSVEVVYPTEFNLLQFSDVQTITKAIDDFVAAGLGRIPTYEKEALRVMYRQVLKGLDPTVYAEIDQQIDTLVDSGVGSRKLSLAVDSGEYVVNLARGGLTPETAAKGPRGEPSAASLTNPVFPQVPPPTDANTLRNGLS